MWNLQYEGTITNPICVFGDSEGLGGGGDSEGLGGGGDSEGSW